MVKQRPESLLDNLDNVSCCVQVPGLGLLSCEMMMKRVACLGGAQLANIRQAVSRDADEGVCIARQQLCHEPGAGLSRRHAAVALLCSIGLACLPEHLQCVNVIRLFMQSDSVKPRSGEQQL